MKLALPSLIFLPVNWLNSRDFGTELFWLFQCLSSPNYFSSREKRGGGRMGLVVRVLTTQVLWVSLVFHHCMKALGPYLWGLCGLFALGNVIEVTSFAWSLLLKLFLIMSLFSEKCCFQYRFLTKIFPLPLIWFIYPVPLSLRPLIPIF